MSFFILHANVIRLEDTITHVMQTEFLGPSLDQGPLPAVFYFSLSAHDSLHLDPYNQPVVFLRSPDIRIFSLTLPGHDRLPPNQALRTWADEVHQGRDVIQTFIHEAADYIYHLIDNHVIDPKKLGLMGLSRGAFIASHLAALLPEVRTILGFAPLTRLGNAKEFQGINTDRWDLSQLTEKLYDRTVRFYIGNRDKRVSTESCFEFISQLAETAYTNKISSSPIELIIGPSMGHQGHGTSPEVFKQGAVWLRHQLGIAHG